MEKEVSFSTALPVRGDRLSNWSLVAVEEGNVGLFEGRQFQYFWRQQTMSSNQVVWLRFKPDTDIHVINQSLEVTEGRVLLEFIANMTAGGTWTPVLVTGLNTSNRLRRQPYYVSGTQVSTGGTPTGTPLVVNAMIISAATGNSAMTNPATFADKTIVGPGDYFVRATALLNSTSFIYRSIWEEIPRADRLGVRPGLTISLAP